jgi:exosortase
MSAGQAIDRAGTPLARAASTGVLLAAAALFTPTLLKLHQYGWNAADYSHAYLIIPVSGWLIWRSRSQLAPAESIRAGPSLLFGLSLAGYASGAVQGFMVFEACLLVLMLWGLFGLRYSRESVERCAFPLAYLLFLIPPPSLAIDLVTVPLRRLCTQGSGALLAGLGLPVDVSGNVLKVGSHELFVSDACSGFRSLTALLALGAVYAYLQPASRGAKWIIFGSVIPLGVAGNILRLGLTGCLAYWFGMPYADGFLHSWSGAVVFLVTIAGLMAVANGLVRTAHAPD